MAPTPNAKRPPTVIIKARRFMVTANVRVERSAAPLTLIEADLSRTCTSLLPHHGHWPRSRSNALLDDRSAANDGHGETAADLGGEAISNFRVPWDGFDYAGLRIRPQGVRTAFTLEVASVPPQMAKKDAALHPTVTVSRIALRGRPRSASLRRSSRMSSIASTRFFRAAAFVRPWPLAPGTSGE